VHLPRAGPGLVLCTVNYAPQGHSSRETTVQLLPGCLLQNETLDNCHTYPEHARALG
jgi:hypothetical protein